MSVKINFIFNVGYIVNLKIFFVDVYEMEYKKILGLLCYLNIFLVSNILVRDNIGIEVNLSFNYFYVIWNLKGNR